MVDPITAVVAVALSTLLRDDKKKQREHDRPLLATWVSQIAPGRAAAPCVPTRRECPVETRGDTEAGQTLSTRRGPDIRQLRVGQRLGEGLPWIREFSGLPCLP